jgi:uncharacterized protein YecE (DUF72 family)
MKWHIGCSGFHYKHWKGSFYPMDLPQKRWFEYYGGQFKTLELNVTFYRFPKLSVLQGRYTMAPVDFRFSVKAAKAITHFKQFHGTVDMLTSFYQTIKDGLQDRLGPVLFQFPPRFHYEEERLNRVRQCKILSKMRLNRKARAYKYTSGMNSANAFKQFLLIFTF